MEMAAVGVTAWDSAILTGGLFHPVPLEKSLKCGHVDGAKAVAGTRVRSVGIDDVDVSHGTNEELHEEPAGPVVVASCLVQACNLVVLFHGYHVPGTRGKIRVTGGRKNIVCKKVGSSLT